MRSTLKCDIIRLRIVGVIYMKTKIIYISGNEIFDMTEIRAAFDEVRDALGLDNDTILFGVPVDKDDAINHAATTEIPTVVDAVCEPAMSSENEIIAEEPIDTTEITPIVDTCTQEPIKEVSQVAQEYMPEDVAHEEKIIPILSVLANKTDVKEQPEIPVIDEVEPVEDTKNTAKDEPEIIVQTVSITTEQSTAIEDQIVSKTITETVVATTEPDDLADVIDEEVPKAPTERTLEQLLESMTPLREDHGTPAAMDEYPTDEMPIFDDADTSEDATLAQLASEFAENADKIVTAPKPESHGKIGKLKNILPFKKAKRDDSGLMGDLFGWAGIAANDEDFSIPGFFTKKQGA